MEKKLYSIEDGQVRLHLHHGQARVWTSKRRFVFMLAGSQSGKTSLGPWWLYNEYKRHGAGDYLAVSSSYDLFKLRMLPEIRTVFEDVLGIGRYWSGDKILELRENPDKPFLAKKASDNMWGRIILRSASSGGGLESAMAKAAWLDECGQNEFTLEDWEAVQRRLSLAQGRVLGTTTLYNRGWLKSEVYDRWNDGDNDYDVIQFASHINPAFPREEYDRAERTLPDWRFKMFYKGEFSRPAGLIYKDFTDDMLVDPFPIPPHWPRVVGIDFGGANTALVWLAQDPETGIWYAFRESLGGGVSSADHAGAARAKIGTGVEDIVFVGGSGSEGQSRLDWTTAGLSVEEPPSIGVEPGISRVTGAIKTNKFRVFRNLKGTRDELGSYSRKLDAAGEPTDEIVDKRKYHRLDALRYAFAHIVGPGDEKEAGFLF